MSNHWKCCIMWLRGFAWTVACYFFCTTKWFYFSLQIGFLYKMAWTCWYTQRCICLTVLYCFVCLSCSIPVKNRSWNTVESKGVGWGPTVNNREATKHGQLPNPKQCVWKQNLGLLMDSRHKNGGDNKAARRFWTLQCSKKYFESFTFIDDIIQ